MSFFKYASTAIFSILFSSSGFAADEVLQLDGWKLLWNDEFSGNKIDATKWSPCKRSTSDWDDTMSNDPRCFVIKDGILQLRGIANDNKEKDPVDFLTGGITTKGKFTFTHGKIVIRARFKSAKGAWPALWMMGASGAWPHNGEIDLMEHLNHDDKIHQTIHSYWANKVDQEKKIPKSATAPIKRDEFNTYGAEWDSEKIVFTCNGKPSFTYVKAPEKGPEQWPFNQPFYLIFSMQIGGDWVGEADPTQYPAWMDIDWVRVYQPRKP